VPAEDVVSLSSFTDGDKTCPAEVMIGKNDGREKRRQAVNVTIYCLDNLHDYSM